MPLRVDVQFRGDPETILTRSTLVSVVIPSGQIGIELWFFQFACSRVISIRHIDSLIIRSRYGILIDHVSVSVEYLSEIFIQIPTVKGKSSKVSTGRFTDVTTFTDTEGHCLICGTPVDIACGTIRIIDMQEYTVLLLSPFCVNSYTAFRHLIKGIFLRAGIIQIPAFKHVTGRRSFWFITIIG